VTEAKRRQDRSVE